jgi:hypothetical protein
LNKQIRLLWIKQVITGDLQRCLSQLFIPIEKSFCLARFF